MENILPTLDAHAHIYPSWASQELSGSGVVLSMSLSQDEAVEGVKRNEKSIVWGVGCHPRKLKAQESFSIDIFQALALQTPLIGEIGLDTGARVPLDLQMRTFRQELEIASRLPRLVSIHSYQATGIVLAELKRKPIAVPILHWWTGTAAETREAVAIGCYFSIHSAVARHSKFRTAVPPERILVESDHGYIDPPAAIPCRIQWVEFLVAQQLGVHVSEVRCLVWQNLARIIQDTGTMDMFPLEIRSLLPTL